MPVIVFPRPTESVTPGVTPVPAIPTKIVELDLGNLISGAILDDVATGTLDTAQLGPLAPTYPVDISEYVRAASTNRGASSELDRIEAGTSVIVLDNRDGRFTPFLAFSSEGGLGSWGS